MAYNSTNLNLRIWDQTSDLFNHTELASNFTKIDTHDHTGGTKGLKIGTTALNDLSISTAKIQDNAVTTVKIPDNAVTTAKIPTNNITTPLINAGAVTNAKIGAAAVTYDKQAIVPHAQIFRSTLDGAQSIANSTNVAVVFPTGGNALGGAARGSGGTANSLLDVHPGLYLVQAQINWAGNSSGYRNSTLLFTPSLSWNPGDHYLSGANQTQSQAINVVVNLNGSHSIALRVFQNSGGALNILESTYLAITYLGPSS